MLFAMPLNGIQCHTVASEWIFEMLIVMATEGIPFQILASIALVKVFLAICISESEAILRYSNQPFI